MNKQAWESGSVLGRALFLGLTVALAAPPAVAASAQVFAGAQVVSGGQLRTYFDSSPSAPLTFSVEAAGLHGGHGNIAGTVSYGHIAVFAQAVSGTELYGFGNSFHDGAQLSVQPAGWYDELTVSGPVGAVTDLVITTSLHALVSCASSAILCGVELTGDIISPHGGQPHFRLGVDNQFHVASLATTTFTIPVLSGDTIAIQNLNFTLSGASGDVGSVSTIDARSTASMFLDINDHAFSLSAASGHNYSTGAPAPVPLPAPLALLLAAVATLRSRRNRRAAAAATSSIAPSVC